MRVQNQLQMKAATSKVARIVSARDTHTRPQPAVGVRLEAASSTSIMRRICSSLLHESPLLQSGPLCTILGSYNQEPLRACLCSPALLRSICFQEFHLGAILAFVECAVVRVPGLWKTEGVAVMGLCNECPAIRLQTICANLEMESTTELDRADCGTECPLLQAPPLALNIRLAHQQLPRFAALEVRGVACMPHTMDLKS